MQVRTAITATRQRDIYCIQLQYSQILTSNVSFTSTDCKKMIINRELSLDRHESSATLHSSMSFEWNCEQIMQSWLVVERLENWYVDQSGGFSTIGLPEHKRATASKIAVGDHLVTYIASKRSVIADIREVTSTIQRRRRPERHFDYDDAYPFVLHTKPMIVLEEADWVSIKSLLSALNLTKNTDNWPQIFRTSLRRLSEEDYSVLRKALQTAKTKS